MNLSRRTRGCRERNCSHPSATPSLPPKNIAAIGPHVTAKFYRIRLLCKDVRLVTNSSVVGFAIRGKPLFFPSPNRRFANVSPRIAFAAPDTGANCDCRLPAIQPQNPAAYASRLATVKLCSWIEFAEKTIDQSAQSAARPFDLPRARAYN
jgi:hypothetical protein